MKAVYIEQFAGIWHAGLKVGHQYFLLRPHDGGGGIKTKKKDAKWQALQLAKAFGIMPKDSRVDDIEWEKDRSSGFKRIYVSNE